MSSLIFLIVVALSIMNATVWSSTRNQEPELISEELEERTNRKIKRQTFGEIETYQRRLLDQFTSVLEPKLKTNGKDNVQKYKHYFRTLPAGQRDTSKIINRKTENGEIKNLSFSPFKQLRQGYWPGFSPDDPMSLDLSSWPNPQFSSQMPSQFSSQMPTQFSSQMPSQFSSPFFPQMSPGMPQSFQSSPLSPMTQQGFPSMMQSFSSSFNKQLPQFPQNPSFSTPFMPQMEQFSSF